MTWPIELMDKLQERVAEGIQPAEISREFDIAERLVVLKIEALGLKYPVAKGGIQGQKFDKRAVKHKPQFQAYLETARAVTRSMASRAGNRKAPPITMPCAPPRALPIIEAEENPEEPLKMPQRNQAMSPEARENLAAAMRASHARRKAAKEKSSNPGVVPPSAAVSLSGDTVFIGQHGGIYSAGPDGVTRIVADVPDDSRREREESGEPTHAEINQILDAAEAPPTHDPVKAVMAFLPPPGSIFPNQKRRAFINLLTAALDYIYGSAAEAESQGNENRQG